MKNKEIIKKIFNSTTRSKRVHEAVLFVENTKSDFSANYGYGGKDLNSPFFTASVSKLFATACILILREQKKLSLDNLIENYLDKTTLDGLHIYKGEDYSRKLKISDLLFQTSGLPDCYEDADMDKLAVQKDYEISFEYMLEKTKALRPRFVPNKANKAYYAEMNFLLLGKIVAKLTGTSLAKAYQELIFTPLGMNNSYLAVSDNDFIPNIYYKNELLHRPKFITSFNFDVISTATDLMRFLKAFYGGLLFPQSVFESLRIYRKLQAAKGPVHYGGGYMQIPLDGIYTFFMGKGELVGHSGSTGSFAFYYPEKDLYFVGDLNQMANPALPIRLVMKLAMSVK
jgi:CubicO group peptidase (beta-lactamase class C family)